MKKERLVDRRTAIKALGTAALSTATLGSSTLGTTVLGTDALGRNEAGGAEETELTAKSERTGAVKSSSPRRTGMGLVIYACSHRRRWLRESDDGTNLFQPLNFLKHCHSLGAGGMQASLGVLAANQIRELRDFAEEHELYIDAIVSCPGDDAGLDRFEAEVSVANQVGAQAARTTIIPGRRYERFKSLDEFRAFERRGEEMLKRAAPVLDKHRVKLAVENHKDQRIEERVALLERLDHEFIGACLDTGNSFALLDGAYEPVEALAPYAFSIHLKDQALRRIPEGFLLGDVPLGQGSFDLPRMVKIIRTARPEIHFTLELITREPLVVPCLLDDYWVTMPKVPASELAKAMRFVETHSVDEMLEVQRLSIEDRSMLEDANVEASLRYAQTELGI